METVEKKILVSAEALFEKHGVVRVSVDEIVKKARVARSSFYRFFKNKDEVFYALLSQYKERGQEEVMSNLIIPKTEAEAKQMLFLRLLGKLNVIMQRPILREMFLFNPDYFSDQINMHHFFDVNIEMLENYLKQLPLEFRATLSSELIIAMDFLFLSTIPWKQYFEDKHSSCKKNDCKKSFEEVVTQMAQVIVEGMFSQYEWCTEELKNKIQWSKN